LVQSSEFCRAQESVQRRRAAETPLENVRLIATGAAAAWAKEAVSAESREARRLHDRAAPQAAGAGKAAHDPWIDPSPSENTDRGFADPGLNS